MSQKEKEDEEPLSKITIGDIGREVSSTQMKWCELCGIKCDNNASFQTHLTEMHPRLNWCRVNIERYRIVSPEPVFLSPSSSLMSSKSPSKRSDKRNMRR